MNPRPIAYEAIALPLSYSGMRRGVRDSGCVKQVYAARMALVQCATGGEAYVPPDDRRRLMIEARQFHPERFRDRHPALLFRG